MRFIFNILWLILGGLVVSIGWFLLGLLWCVTIIGLPVGIQCLKFAGLCFWPFGRDVELGGGAMSTLANILWIIFGGLELALVHAALGLVLSITIIGLPFGRQYFKLAKLSLMPFGATIR